MNWSIKSRITGPDAFLSGWLGNRVITSIQKGLIAFTNGDTTKTATITTVNPARALLIWDGCGQDAPSSGSNCATVALTNATTVTADRIAPGTNSMVVGFTVIAGTQALFRTVQRGTITILAAALSGTATITAVNTSHAVVSVLGYRNGLYPVRVVVTNATTVTASIDDAGGGGAALNLIVGFQVVEYW